MSSSASSLITREPVTTPTGLCRNTAVQDQRKCEEVKERRGSIPSALCSYNELNGGRGGGLIRTHTAVIFVNHYATPVSKYAEGRQTKLTFQQYTASILCDKVNAKNGAIV